jgi:RNA polymerase sigma-70 factor (ECF subfamily)
VDTGTAEPAAADPPATEPPTLDAEHLYRAEGSRLWWSVLAFCGDADVASDAVSEAFAQLLRRDGEVRFPSRWVWRAAFRIAAGELKRRSTTVPIDGHDRSEEEGPSDVLSLLAELTPRQRAAVVLHHYAGYPLKEIAAILGSSPATIGVHLTRGRRRLRDLLEASDD